MNGKILGTLVVCLFINACTKTQEPASNATQTKIEFVDVSADIGLTTQANWKYGGPSISDINKDGYYDLLLTNHDTTPVELFLSNNGPTYLKQPDLFKQADLHGISAGDYDLDGDNDVLLSLGGGNGLRPQPQRLLRNDNGSFVDVTEEAGISEMGARGRAVRWVDIDNDGDLDFMQVNAPKVVNEEVPRNILFENNGDGTFQYVSSPEFENMEAERLLITDYNNDNIMDILGYDGYSETTLWRGNGDFTFSNVTEKLLPHHSNGYKGTLTAAHADIDGDGDLDYYLARGILYFTLADNSVFFDSASKRLDLRDQGIKSHDGMFLFANGDITFTDFYHFPRAKKLDHMPVFLGKNKTLIATPYEPRSISQQEAMGFPEEVTETGWYLGYLGDGKWRFEWILTDDLAWDLRASVIGIERFETEWEPQSKIIKDVLLRNDGDKFTDISEQLPKETHLNNWGVVPGDFNNDGKVDFFVHRFGELRRRIEDVLLVNTGDSFSAELATSATTELGNDSHGDMGAAFDYDLDGRIDMLNGDDDNGQWHMYKNISKNVGNYLLLNIGYSEKGTDPYAAKVSVTSDVGTIFKLIGSGSESHSQSLLSIAHFGLGSTDVIKSINIRWRDGSTKTMKNVKANQILKVGEF